MTNRFEDGHRPVGGLYLPLGRSRLGLADRLASRTGRRLLELLGMLAGESLIDRPPQQASDFVAELLNLCEGRILRRPLRSVPHGRQCYHTRVELFLSTERINAINQHFITAFLDLNLKDDAAKSAYLDVTPAVAGEGQWPIAPFANVGGRYAADQEPDYWRGFQRRWAIGLEMRRGQPEDVGH